MSSNEASERRLNHINMKPNIEGVCVRVCVCEGGRPRVWFKSVLHINVSQSFPWLWFSLQQALFLLLYPWYNVLKWNCNFKHSCMRHTHFFHCDVTHLICLWWSNYITAVVISLIPLYCWMTLGELCCVFTFQEPGMMTPQQVRRRRMTPSIRVDTMSMCGTSTTRMDLRPVTLTASPTPTHPRWTQSEMSTQDSSVSYSSANQVSISGSKVFLFCYVMVFWVNLTLQQPVLSSLWNLPAWFWKEHAKVFKRNEFSLYLRDKNFIRIPVAQAEKLVRNSKLSQKHWHSFSMGCQMPSEWRWNWGFGNVGSSVLKV